jgi:hypothetical protein
MTMQRLEGLQEVLVVQEKEWGEILTDFEHRNRYRVIAPDGAEILHVSETNGSTLARILLRSWRPFTLTLTTPDGKPAFVLERPFKFYFTEVIVKDAHGKKLGRVQRRFSLLRRQYSVFDATGREILQLYGPLFHPWTFEMRRAGTTVGKIGKQWGGVLREGFTDADRFGIAFPADAGADAKAVLLGATLLIDFAHFERG